MKMLHGNIPERQPEINYKFWVTNDWKTCCWGTVPHIDFTLFSYSQGKVYSFDMSEAVCFIVTLFNFSFVLKIRSI